MHILIFKSLTKDTNGEYKPEYLHSITEMNRVVTTRNAQEALNFIDSKDAKKFLQMNAIAFAWNTIQIPEN